ncbi:MAG: hypothetical protein IPK16_07735 [Anaerolineales bacterium]|nr:hypothetical protein [Anaerolineales bacterium]
MTRKVRSFVTSIDTVGFIADAQFRELVQAMAQVSATPENPVPDDLDQNLEMVGFMAPMIFRDLAVSGSSTIGLDDFYAYAQSFDMVWDLSGLLQLAAASDPALRAQLDGGSKPGFGIRLNAEMGDYNQDFEIQPPDDVEIIPLDQMSPMNEDVVS